MLYSPSSSVSVQPNVLYPTSSPYSSAASYGMPQASVPSPPMAAPSTSITINNIFTSLCNACATPAQQTPQMDSYTPSNLLYSTPQQAQPQPVTYVPAPMMAMQQSVAYAPPPVAYPQPPVAYSQAPVTYSQPPVTYSPAPVAYSQPPAANAPAPMAYPTSPMTYATDMNSFLTPSTSATPAQSAYCPPMTAMLTPTPGAYNSVPTPVPTPGTNTPVPTPCTQTGTPTPTPSTYPPTPTPGTYPPTPQPPVAKNKHSDMWGDPHVDTASGGKYDFQKIGFYNVLSDKNINLNAKLDGEQGKPTFITEAGLKLGTHQLDVKSDGSTQIGSGGSAIVLQDGQTITLDDGSTIAKKGSVITANTPEYKIKFETGKIDSTVQHINLTVDSRASGVMADGIAPTGILGEGFNTNTGKQNAPLLDENTYQRSDLFDSSSNAATRTLARQNLNKAIGQNAATSPAPSAPAMSAPSTPTLPGTQPNGSASLPTGSGSSTGINMMLQMMTMFTQMLQAMMQLLGQGSNQLAA